MNIEEFRVAFEAWHRAKYKTAHQTGQPTRDMHNGVRAEQYGPEEEQDRWEAWQACAAVTSKQFEADAKRSAMRLKELDLLFGRQLMVMRAAVIEMEHGDGHEAGMAWIFNQLFATSQFAPDEATDSDAYFEQEVKPINVGLAEVFAFFHPQYAGESETLKRPRNDACCGCVRSDHAGPCAEQSASKPAQQMPDKESICRAVVDICDRIPGSTAWNAAEFAYDEMVARLGGVKP